MTHMVGEGEYTALDVTQSSFINGGNVYQECTIQQLPPPGYAVPSNIPATSQKTIQTYPANHYFIVLYIMICSLYE